MGVDVDGLADVFEDLDDLQDDYGGQTEDWVVGTPVEYSVYVEYGTSPHVIEGDPLLYFNNREGQLISKAQVEHPGTDPQPFFRPAINEVRLQGPRGFIRHNTRKKVEEIGSTREFVQTLALALERRISELAPVNTGNLRASVEAVPIGDIRELTD